MKRLWILLLLVSFFHGSISVAQDTIITRFTPPDGFTRVNNASNSFGDFLQHFKLLEEGSNVVYFNGAQKHHSNHAAVLDIDVGKKDLQQCADAVMRLRAEYLYANQKFGEIHFNFTNGFKADYLSWQAGHRLGIKGNKTWWNKNKAKKDSSYEGFRRYLDLVFTYAGTISLKAEMKATQLEEIKVGDVFIQSGSPGHAMIVVDKAVKEDQIAILLAQSYMPAQSIHIVNNPQNTENSPWFIVGKGDELITPDWVFQWGDLKSF